MSQHSHSQFVDGCYRCDLGRDELQASDDLNAVEKVISDAMSKCRFPDDDLAIDAADAVLDWARTEDGRAVLSRAMAL